ncbi:MAG: hypothetical protein HRT38_05745 [Alteromonadaceae bacterium]|nr:hypothetical protein [Alteromonadaceae bacterium]
MTCNTSTVAKERNQLCPGSRDYVSNAVFIVSGPANATVNVLVEIMPVVTNGIRFSLFYLGVDPFVRRNRKKIFL